jgi:hypothetical protein
MNIFRPYKSDIHQIESLVSLGVNPVDISRVLGITITQLRNWEQKNPKVSELLKTKPRPEYTLSHPEYAPMVEEAFTCAGRRFYRFKEEYRMSTGRYKYYSSTLRELDLKLSLKDLQKFVDAFKAVLNGGKKKVIEITDLTVLIYNLESRIKLAFDNETIYKLAAIAYFDETEDLVSYSDKYGEDKIKLWRDNHMHDFFFDEAYRRVIHTEQYLHRLFGGAYDDSGADSEGPELQSAESIRGQFLRGWEEDLVLLADGDPTIEKQLRKMDIFSFLNRILALKKKEKANSSDLDTEPFGTK